MKGWECIKEIMENDSKEFINNVGEIIYYDKEVMKIAIRQDNYRYDVSIVLDRDNMFGDWQPIEKEVSFVKAIKSKKEIKLSYIYGNKLHSNSYTTLPYLLMRIGEELYEEDIRELMLGDNFIIEEEE